MENQDFLFDAELLQQKIFKLHMARKAGKIPSVRKGKLTKKERALIFSKTDGKCHVCGDQLSLESFEADHIISHVSGGLHKVDNFLPACFICNNYRWHYLPEELQLVLKLGVWAKTVIENKTALGNLMATKFVGKENSRIKNKRSNKIGVNGG